MNFVVAGVGYTGRRVLDALPADTTTGLSRSPVEACLHDVRIIDFDGAERIELPEAAVLLYTAPPDTVSDDDTRLAAFLGAIEPAPRRIVYLSTSGVYGDRRGELTDESVPPDPGPARSRRRLAAERRLERWCSSRGCELFILRVPGIYGPGRLGLERLRAGDAMLCDDGAPPGNRIHVDDLVACCIAAMTGNAPPGIYNVSDGDHRSSTEFSRAVARLSGLPAPAEIGWDEAARLWGESRLSFLREPRRLDTRKMRELLGVVPRYADPEDGIRASLE